MQLTMFLIGFLSVLTLFYVYFRWSFSYWSRRNVPGIAPKIPLGNLGSFKEGTVVFTKKLYDDFKCRDLKHAGLYAFTKPFYVPIDLEYIKNILTRDFQYFSDHGIYCNERDDPVSAHLFNLNGAKWKRLRAKLTPTFTTGKIKSMFPMLMTCAEQLVQALNSQIGVPLDIKDVLGCYTTDVIGMCAFGLDCDSFQNPNNFKKCGKEIFAPARGWQRMKVIAAILNHRLGHLLRVVTTPEPKAFLMKVIKNAVEHRETTGFSRKDFLQILIDLKNASGDQPGLTIEEIAAQSYVFFAAGFETSSTTLTFCLYELATNQDFQNRLRAEINSNLKDRPLSYDVLMDLNYLDRVVEETLRKYPPAGVITRQCVVDYEALPDVVIEKGTLVLVPIFALHRDPDFFPDPEKFDPDRFDEVNRNKIVPYTYMPFGEGPRICIGARFGLMQVKVALVALIRQFQFRVNSRTREPLQMNPQNYILTVKGDVWLDVEKC